MNGNKQNDYDGPHGVGGECQNHVGCANWLSAFNLKVFCNLSNNNKKKHFNSRNSAECNKRTTNVANYSKYNMNSNSKIFLKDTKVYEASL